LSALKLSLCNIGLLPEITLSVTVQGELMHSNDMN
jgi:hypothetical protein